MTITALLSPSKTLNMDARALLGTATQPQFLADTQELARIMKQHSANDIKTLMKVSDTIAELNHARFQGFSTPFTADNAKQAIYLFKGDVYDGLEAESLDDNAVRYLNDHVRILSGFYGLIKPLDLLQPYRLEMSIKLANERGKNLYEFWGTKLADALSGSDAIINLASNEYNKAVDRKRYAGRWVDVAFKEEKDGKYRVLGLYAKKARGMMARFMAERAVDDVETLKEFDAAGYRFKAAESAENSLVFTRKQP